MFNTKYIFILDTLLTYSDLFVYRYVIDTMGILNYKILNDLDIIKPYVTNDNIILMNWSSSINYAYLNNNEVVVNKFNNKIMDSLKKKYILEIGDNKNYSKLKTPILKYEFESMYIFNFIK